MDMIKRRDDGDDYYMKVSKIMNNRHYKKTGRKYDDRTGYIRNHPIYGPIQVITYNNSRDIIVKFLNTGFVTDARIDQLMDDGIKDNRHVTICDRGFLGDDVKILRRKYPEIYEKIYHVWRDMLRRCYDKNNHAYDVYGGSGITVDSSWFNFSAFFNDIVKFPSFDMTRFVNGELTLDKDKLQQGISKKYKVYSKDTCCWLTILEQSIYIETTIYFTAIHPDGHETVEHNMSDFARSNNLIACKISDCINVKRVSHGNYKFKPISKSVTTNSNM